MKSQFYLTVILCAGVGLAPLKLVASDLKANPRPQIQTAKAQAQTLHERRLLRMLQYHQRRAALQRLQFRPTQRPVSPLFTH